MQTAYQPLAFREWHVDLVGMLATVTYLQVYSRDTDTRSVSEYQICWVDFVPSLVWIRDA